MTREQAILLVVILLLALEVRAWLNLIKREDKNR